MALFIASLNSGSNGNCYYLGNQDDAILVDAGISCRETERRMKKLGLSMKQVRAIFITHEHSDHISGVHQLSKKYRLPVYITANTLNQGRLELIPELTFPFRPYEAVHIGQMTVTPFPKEHDASDPHSFMVTYDNVNVGVFTDIGLACEHVIRHFRQCHAAFLESNYDTTLLETGRYPIYLKNRIRGGKGHLSNDQAVQLFTEHRPEFMTHLLLSHLSHHNNNPNIVQNLFEPVAGPTEIIIASRYKESKLYLIRNIPGFQSRPILPVRTETQLSLF